MADELLGSSRPEGDGNDSEALKPEEDKKSGSSASSRLEIYKIGVSLLTPILIFYFGLQLKQIDDKRLDREYQQKLDVDKKNRAEDLVRQDRSNQDTLQKAKDDRQAEADRESAARQFQAAQAALQRSADYDRQRAQEDFERARQNQIDNQRDYEARTSSLKAITKVLIDRSSALIQFATAHRYETAVYKHIFYALPEQLEPQKHNSSEISRYPSYANSIKNGVEFSEQKAADIAWENYNSTKTDWNFNTRYNMLPFERTSAKTDVDAVESNSLLTINIVYEKIDQCMEDQKFIRKEIAYGQIDRVYWFEDSDICLRKATAIIKSCTDITISALSDLTVSSSNRTHDVNDEIISGGCDAKSAASDANYGNYLIRVYPLFTHTH